MKKIYIYIFISAMLMFVNTNSNLINTIIYSICIVPLAFVLGELTDVISQHIGEKKGGLLAAGIGNIPELIMGVWSIRYGMISMVKSSLIGAIISNILLVLGISIFLGGIKYKLQKFNKIVARTNFSMLLLAMSTMIIIASLNKYNKFLTKGVLVSLSIKVSIVLVIIYILGLIFSLYTHSNLFVISEENQQNVNKDFKVIKNIIIALILSGIFIYLISEKLIFNLKELTKSYNISQQFLGLILIPLLGNIGENISAIMCAMKNKINLSLEIAIGSSIQISLFVTPILIIISSFFGLQMTLLFSSFEIIIGVIAITMSFFVFQDGKTYWFEGAILIAIYIIVTLAYYYFG